MAGGWGSPLAQNSEHMKSSRRSALAAWVRYIAPPTRNSAATWPSRCCPPRWRKIRSASARFHREAKALAALDHPNIVTIHSVEEFDGIHFLTMELVEGLPLDRLIPKGAAGRANRRYCSCAGRRAGGGS